MRGMLFRSALSGVPGPQPGCKKLLEEEGRAEGGGPCDVETSQRAYWIRERSRRAAKRLGRRSESEGIETPWPTEGTLMSEVEVVRTGVLTAMCLGSMRQRGSPEPMEGRATLWTVLLAAEDTMWASAMAGRGAIQS